MSIILEPDCGLYDEADARDLNERIYAALLKASPRHAVRISDLKVFVGDTVQTVDYEYGWYKPCYTTILATKDESFGIPKFSIEIPSPQRLNYTKMIGEVAE